MRASFPLSFFGASLHREKELGTSTHPSKRDALYYFNGNYARGSLTHGQRNA